MLDAQAAAQAVSEVEHELEALRVMLAAAVLRHARVGLTLTSRVHAIGVPSHWERHGTQRSVCGQIPLIIQAEWEAARCTRCGQLPALAPVCWRWTEEEISCQVCLRKLRNGTA